MTLTDPKDPETIYWKEVETRAPYVAIEKCEEAARQLISLTSLLMTVFFGIFSFKDVLKLNLSTLTILLFISPLVLLLVSLILATQVIMPRKYAPEQDEDIRNQYIRIRDTKHRFLRYSYTALITSMLVVLTAITFYLLQ
jgi:hypothetical protein